jgi:catechol 2,3-dioxygenase-like lactoylglutathione lyase family enzyme
MAEDGPAITTREEQMVSDNRISAVFLSSDLEACRDFYENKVGLELSPETIENHLLFECGDGTTLLVHSREGNKADHAQVRFWSKDIDADVAELAGCGVVLRGVRLGELQDRRPRGHDRGHRIVGLV